MEPVESVPDPMHFLGAVQDDEAASRYKESESEMDMNRDRDGVWLVCAVMPLRQLWK